MGVTSGEDRESSCLSAQPAASAWPAWPGRSLHGGLPAAPARLDGWIARLDCRIFLYLFIGCQQDRPMPPPVRQHYRQLPHPCSSI